MSLWANYIAERLGQSIIEEPWGFVSFKIVGSICDVIDLYVIPEERMKGRTRDLYEELFATCRQQRVQTLVVSVWPGIAGSDISMKAALGHGFRLHSTDGARIILTKDIGG